MFKGEQTPDATANVARSVFWLTTIAEMASLTPY